MTQRTLYLAAYDITDPSRLRRALHVLRDYATGGQKSVFECFLTPAEKQELETRMNELLDHEADRFFTLRLCPRRKPLTLGIGTRPVDPTYFYFG
jgi:CRISPR-associated protein Cas2